MCGDTERLKMLIVLHICLFLMSHDNGDMTLRESEIDVLYSQSKKMYLDFFGKISKCIIYLMVNILGSILSS